MNNWTPISEAEVWDLTIKAWEEMSLPQRRLWEVIKIEPIKWQQAPYGTQGGGFWVVAIYGSTVVWFNDIEHGFNRSTWSNPGVIDEYWCNQDELQWTVQHVLNEWQDGSPSGGRCGPPQPIQ
jgi:hypothetical protein